MRTKKTNGGAADSTDAMAGGAVMAKYLGETIDQYP